MLHICIVLCCFLSQDVAADGETQASIEKHRASPAFRSFFLNSQQQSLQKQHLWKRTWQKTKNAFIPASVSAEYDVFTWWWVRECVRDASFDPGGVVTQDLLTKAVGFGGWYTKQNPQGVRVDKLKLYRSAALLFYWSFYEAPPPSGGPVLLNRLWQAARQKQCLRIEPHMLMSGDVDDWIKSLTIDGWTPGTLPLDEAINNKFGIKDSALFEKTLGEPWLEYYGSPEELRKWLGQHPFVTLATLLQTAYQSLKGDNIAIDTVRTWLKNMLILSRVMDAPMMLKLLKQGDTSYISCLYMILNHHEIIEDKDIHEFRSFLLAFNPDHLDVEQHKKYLRWLNMALFSAFQHRWTAKHGQKEKKLDATGDDNPIAVFRLMYDEEVKKGLWPEAKQDFPYVMLFLSLTTHGDIEAHNTVYQAALTRTLRHAHNLETMQGVQDFLWVYLHNIEDAMEAKRTQYVVTEAGTMGDKKVNVGDIVTNDVKNLPPQKKKPKAGEAKWEKQEICLPPYNIWDGSNKDVIAQRISMAIDHLFVKGKWPANVSAGLIQRSNKLAMLMLVHQRHLREQPS